MLARARWLARAQALVVVVALTGVAGLGPNQISGCGAGTGGADAAPSVSIGAVGDLLIYDVGHTVPADGGASYFAAVEPLFTQDFITGNLEQNITNDTGQDKCAGQDRQTCLVFRSDPDSAQYFSDFDLLSLANNHGADFGIAGMANTEANLAASGVATTGRRDQIGCAAVRGRTVAVVGFSTYPRYNNALDLNRARKVVAAAARTADLVIVHANIGAEGPEATHVSPGMEYFLGEQRGDVTAFAHAMVDAGADLVVGHGPHVMRAMEFYRGRLIAYSLGNFGGGGVFGVDDEYLYGAYLAVTLRADGTFVNGQIHSIRFDRNPSEGKPVPDPQDGALRRIRTLTTQDFPVTGPHIDPAGHIEAP